MFIEKCKRLLRGKPKKFQSLDMLKEFEGLRLKAYLPTPDDVWTIGYGHTRGVYEGLIIDYKKAEEFLIDDLKRFEDCVNEVVKVKITQNMFDAMVSLAFNIGCHAFENSTLVKKINQEDYEGAAAEFPRWKFQKGKILAGLLKRRLRERALFLKWSK